MRAAAVACALLLVASRVVAYESACTYPPGACEDGPGHARGRWIALDDEHRVMWELSLQRGGLPARLSESELVTLLNFTGAEEAGGAEKIIEVAGDLLPSLIPVDFALTRRATNRGGPLTVGEFTQLPDFSYSLWDWVFGNETCPLDAGAGITDAKACHTFSSHMGPVNSSHFPPQSREFYAHYHGLAMERARSCDALATRLGSSRDRLREFVLACEQQAFILEAIAHHFLQDTWSAGHMWERWGSPDPAPFRIAPLEATAVAGVSGLIHGARSFLKDKPVFNHADINDAMCAPHPDVEWMSPSQPTPAPAVGDSYQYLFPQYPAQDREFFSCAVSSIRQVYDLLTAPEVGPLTLPDPSLRSVDPLAECFSQRVTNRALRAGTGLNFTIPGDSQVDVPIDPIGASAVIAEVEQILEDELIRCDYLDQSVECSELLARLRVDLALIVTEIEIAGRLRPLHQDLASGALPDFLGFRPNGAYVQDAHAAQAPLASYMDPPLPWPGDGTNPRALALARTFHQAHAEDWCSIIGSAELQDLKIRSAQVVATGDQTRIFGANRVCAEFARRHLYRWTPLNELVPEPPLCALASATPSVALLHRLAAGNGSPEDTASVWCTCGNGRLDPREQCDGTAPNGDVSCPGRCRAPGHTRTIGQVDVLDDCTCQDCDKGNGVESVSCDEAQFDDYPSCQAGNLVAYLGFPTGPNPPAGAREIFVMRPDGNGRVQLTNFCGLYLLRGLTWSPDRSKLAFVGYQAGTSSNVYLFVMDADGTEVTRFHTFGFGNITGIGPSWSPDGSKMAIVLGGGVYTFDLTTKEFLKIATNPSATHYYDQPAWSPNGEYVAVRIHHQGTGPPYNFRDDIGIVPATGGTVTNLTTNRNPDGSLGDAGCLNGSPSWSPDSTKIVFHDGGCIRPDPTTMEAYASRLATVTVPGGTMALLTPLPSGARFPHTNPSYSPDGNTLIFEFPHSVGPNLAGSFATMPAAGGVAPTGILGAFGERATWRPVP